MGSTPAFWSEKEAVPITAIRPESEVVLAAVKSMAMHPMRSRRAKFFAISLGVSGGSGTAAPRPAVRHSEPVSAAHADPLVVGLFWAGHGARRALFPSARAGAVRAFRHGAKGQRIPR